MLSMKALIKREFLEHRGGHCQRKNNYMPKSKFGVWLPLISHGFSGSDKANPRRFMYSEFSSDSTASVPQTRPSARYLDFAAG
jgi:hypothetical protein